MRLLQRISGALRVGLMRVDAGYCRPGSLPFGTQTTLIGLGAVRYSRCREWLELTSEGKALAERIREFEDGPRRG